MNIEQAKAIAVTEILKIIGISPTKEDETDATYLSPIRKEKTPSFHVNKKKNVWYDHGSGKGGNSFDFVRQYLKYTNQDHNIPDVLRWIKNMCATAPVIIPAVHQETETQPGWKIIRTEELEDLALFRYLKKRGINVQFAKQHVTEVYVRSLKTNTKVYAIGFKNEDGGYELRNSFLKSSVSPKTITFIRGSKPKPHRIHIFEGFMDYLTFLTIVKGKHEDDVIVLNSTSCVEKAMPYIKNYGYCMAFTWLHNDEGGNKAKATLSAFFKTQPNLMHKPMNNIYRPHKDLNEWHMHNLNLKL